MFSGVLVTNLAARNEDKKLEVLYAFQQVYCTIVCLPLQEDVNDIVVGMKTWARARARNGIDCSNCYCSHFEDENCSISKEDDSVKANDENPSISKSDEESITSRLEELSFSSTGTSWKSSSVGKSESVCQRLSYLMTVIERNGGNIEGLETELTQITMCKAK